MTNDDELIKLLLSHSPRAEAVYVMLRRIGPARTNEVATALGMDRSNAGKYLEQLEREGRVAVVENRDASLFGRPSRVWAIVA